MSSWRAFSTGLRELRIHLCNTSDASKGVREFIERQYVGLKKANPSLPILVRECADVEPRLYARFDYGQETKVSLSNLTRSGGRACARTRGCGITAKVIAILGMFGPASMFICCGVGRFWYAFTCSEMYDVL
eukprot:Opistho-2@89331